MPMPATTPTVHLSLLLYLEDLIRYDYKELDVRLPTDAARIKALQLADKEENFHHIEAVGSTKLVRVYTTTGWRVSCEKYFKDKARSEKERQERWAAQEAAEQAAKLKAENRVHYVTLIRDALFKKFDARLSKEMCEKMAAMFYDKDLKEAITELGVEIKI